MFFITNFNRQESYKVNLSFMDDVTDKYVWIGDMVTGERYRLNKINNNLSLRFGLA